MLYSFLHEMGKNINEVVSNGYASNLRLVTEGTLEYIPIKEKQVPLHFMDDAISVLSSLEDGCQELENFFSNIYTSDKINSVPVNVPLMDVSEIKNIKPKYLVQYIKDNASLIQKSMNYKLNVKSKEVIKITDPEYIKNLKKQIVVSSLPDYLKGKELINLDRNHVYNLDSDLITTVVLPFLQTIKVQLDGFKKESAEIQKVIIGSIDTINNYYLTVMRLKDEGKDVNIKCTFLLLQGLVINFMNITNYVVSCFIRKVNSYTHNLKEFYAAKESFLRYYPEGDTLLHESVMDGENDYLEEDIVISLLNGNCDFLISTLDRIYKKFYTILNEEYHKHGRDFTLTTSFFDTKTYKRIEIMLEQIKTEFVKFRNEVENPDTSIEDIIQNSGLDIIFTNQFSDLLNSIPSLDFYTSYEDADKNEVYMALLNEINYVKEYRICYYTKIIEKLYEYLKKNETDIEQNVNGIYTNEERNKETIQAIYEIDKNYRTFLLMLAKAMLKRYNNMEEEMLSSNIVVEPDKLEYDLTNYISESERLSLELDDMLYNHLYNKMYQKYLTEKTVSIMMEAGEENNNNQNNTQPTVNNNQQNNNTGQNDQNNKENTKVQVQDNNTETKSNASDNKTKLDKSFIDSMMEKIRNFFNKIAEKLSKASPGQKTNAEWLNKYKDGLLKRSYTNVSVNMLPYEEFDYFAMIDEVIGKVKNLSKETLLKTKTSDLEGLLFAQYNLSSVKTENKDLSSKLVQYLKIKDKNLETVTFKDGDLGSKIPKMIEYCENYYNNSSKSFETKKNDIQKTSEEFGNKISNDNSEQQPVEGANLESALTTITTGLNTMYGACLTAMRDKANDYMQVLNSLAPKEQPKENNSQQNENQNNNESNENNQTNNNETSTNEENK